MKPTLWERFCIGFRRGWSSVRKDIGWVRIEILSPTTFRVDGGLVQSMNRPGFLVWPLLDPKLAEKEEQ